MDTVAYANKSCADRVVPEMNSTMETLRSLLDSYNRGEEYCPEEETNIFDYSLCFDYVEDEDRDFFRYQISWGGPSDEIRFFVNRDLSFDYAEYWFLDWFDGANRLLRGDNEVIAKELFNIYDELGSVQSQYNEEKGIKEEPERDTFELACELVRRGKY